MKHFTTSFQANYYTDPTTGVQLYKDANDGMVYEWDKSKNAWFPRIDEDFMAVYQMNYGFTPDGIFSFSFEDYSILGKCSTRVFKISEKK